MAFEDDDKIFVNGEGELVDDPSKGKKPLIQAQDTDEEIDEEDDDLISEDLHEEDDSKKKTEADFEDERIATGTGQETDPDREAIRERRRQERKDRKQATKSLIDGLKRDIQARDVMLNDMRSQMEAFQRNQVGFEISRLEGEMGGLKQQYDRAKEIHRQAIEVNDGETAANAVEKMQQLSERFNQLNFHHKNLSANRGRPAPADPRVTALAQQWQAKNSWYNPQSGDQDSLIALTIDQSLAATSGLHPGTEAYWNELDARLKKALPHRYTRTYNGSNGERRSPRTVVPGSGKDAGATPGAKGSVYHLSADRVSALKEAGLWDDPKKRAEAIKRYIQFDKENKI